MTYSIERHGNVWMVMTAGRHVVKACRSERAARNLIARLTK